MKMKIFAAAVAACGAIASTEAFAATVGVDFGPSNIAVPAFSGGNTLDINVVVPTTAVTLTGFTLTVEGDLDQNNENFALSIDGLSLGTLLNGNSVDDPFDFSGATDVGSVDGLTGDASLALDVASIVGDGAVVLSFSTSSEVNAPKAVNDGTFPGFTGQFAAKGVLTFETSETAVVPVPASLPLLAFGLGGLGLMARRKRKVS